jgi:alpha-L-fucosidase 2
MLYLPGFGNQVVKKSDCNLSNLFNARRHVFQIDGNFGGEAAIAEMLLQSHGGTIRVLPALPAAWSKGCFTGFCARGGFELDVVWSGGKPRCIHVRSHLGRTCRIAFAGAENGQVSCNEVSVRAQRPEHGTIAFETVAGQVYAIKVP